MSRCIVLVYNSRSLVVLPHLGVAETLLRRHAVIGFAIARESIPVPVRCWPGNTGDLAGISEVRRDLVGGKLGRAVTVLDRGFVSEDNLKTLRRAGGHYNLFLRTLGFYSEMACYSDETWPSWSNATRDRSLFS